LAFTGMERRRLSLREPSQLDRVALAVNLASWGEETLREDFAKGMPVASSWRS